MRPRTKQILASVMLFGDILLGLFFLAELLDGVDSGISLFMVLFLAVDAFLTVDYIRENGFKIKHSRDLDKANKAIKKRKTQLNKAEKKAVEEMEEEEDLVDLLTRKQQNQYEETGVKRL